MKNKIKKLVALFMALVLTIGIMSGYTSANVVRADGSVEITADKEYIYIYNGTGNAITENITYKTSNGQYYSDNDVSIESDKTYTKSLSAIFEKLVTSYGIFQITVQLSGNVYTSQALRFVNAKPINLQIEEKTLTWNDAWDTDSSTISVDYHIYVENTEVNVTSETTYDLSTYNFEAGKTYTINVTSEIKSSLNPIVISDETETITYTAPSDTSNTETDTSSDVNKNTETTESSSSSSSDSSSNESSSSDISSDDSDSSSSEPDTHQPSVGDSQGWDKIDKEINKVLSAPATDDGLKVLNVTLTDEDYIPENAVSAVANSGIIMSVRLNDDTLVNIDGSEIDASDASFTKFSIDDSSDYSTFIVNTAGKNLLKTITIFRRFPSQYIGHTVSLYFFDANGERITFATSPVYANGYAVFKIPFVHAKYHIAID